VSLGELTDATVRYLYAMTWLPESDGDYSQHLCPAHKRNDWEALRQAMFRSNLETAHRTPG